MQLGLVLARKQGAEEAAGRYLGPDPYGLGLAGQPTTLEVCHPLDPMQ